MDQPVVYFKPGCPFGLRLRAALVLHRVAHRSVRFRDDEDGAARVRAVNGGNEISPTVEVAGRWLTNPGWREVRDATSGALALAAALVLLVGCGADDSPPPTGPQGDAASTSATAGASGTSQDPAASPLEGTWRTGPITVRETEATVRRHGLGRHVEDYRANAPFLGTTELTLTIANGAWDLYGTSGASQPEPIDYDADYEIDGDIVVFHHSDGSNTYRWEVDGETLTLQFVGSTLPGYRGIPEEVFQRALYMTATFTRQG